jgi:hypothetical protein
VISSTKCVILFPLSRSTARGKLPHTFNGTGGARK